MANFFRKLFGGFSASRISDEFDREIGGAQVARCKFCGRKIIWKNIKNGKRWPLNLSKTVVVDDEGNVFEGFLPHFKTCSKWRDK
ncbi:MAG: hypothetical protein COT16_01510 [Elusimicrobia bacterium CG08_land_8_20_14_0_20_44_26]|nr:MAG: hypothetical protein COT16_01510 [Elusimicrobia bacterium CG08_land_8_20_14_0_20_44_26]